jgi:hypothetical protein
MKNIILGIKKAWQVPSLPKKVHDFQNHIFIRIYRFIGGISILITLLHSKNINIIKFDYYLSENFIELIYFYINIFAVIFIIFIIIINLIKIVYTIYLLIKKPETFEVKNSPLNIFATQIAKVLSCMKIGCIATGSTAAVVAGGVTFDTLIEKTGRDPIFIPMMAEGLNLILGKPTNLSDIQNILPEVSKENESLISSNTDFSQEAISNVLNNYKNLSISEKEVFWKEVSKEFNKN